MASMFGEQGRTLLTDTDVMRTRVNGTLHPDRKSALGQFMTPSMLAEFMASLFERRGDPVALLDAGAGIGSLTIAAIQKLAPVTSVDAWEIDPVMRKHLEKALASLGGAHQIHPEDFIVSAVQQIAFARGARYTHAILNPPYKKLNSNSEHRALLRKIGIETVNLYSAFVALSVLLMKSSGQIVAIIPRSFCNGPYYKPFRRFILGRCSIDRIHVFESRNRAFKDDDVLQENVIIKLVGGKQQGQVVVSCSHDQHLSDYAERSIPFAEVIKPADPEVFIHVPTGSEDLPKESSDLFAHSLGEIGLQVSTGPVVDFRLREYWLSDPQPNSIPLVYPHHFSGKRFEFPKQHKKPNALLDSDEVQRWLMPNACYVLVKRFSSKEEKRRIVAYVYDPANLDSKQVGFENHWNVFHSQHRGIDPVLARGFACFLNSSAIDNHFRKFSGHTQINATDLRNMKYPSLELLRKLGQRYSPGLTQPEVDEIINRP